MKNCLQCNADISRRHHLAAYCFSCIEKRAKISNKTKSCLSCRTLFSTKYRRHCDDCFSFIQKERGNWETNGGKQYAGTIVGAAVRRGYLPKLDGSVPCIDCGRAAQHYDHRDYNYPLLVQPVCRSCNSKRGRAVPLSGYKPISIQAAA
jgi:hypothetical protein